MYVRTYVRIMILGVGERNGFKAVLRSSEGSSSKVYCGRRKGSGSKAVYTKKYL
jgi:hypothetical protein